MAPRAVFTLVLLASAITVSVASCSSSEANIDCNFHSLVAGDWPDLSARTAELSAAWKSEAAKAPAYPAGRYSGRGLVVTARTLDVVNVPVLLSVLQSQGFDLPVEVWYSGDIDADVINSLSSSYKDLVIRNVANYASAEDLQPSVTSQGSHVFQAKVLAILNSAFEEVLFLDADNVPVSNPAILFDSDQYQKIGALFWPDFWQTASENPIWSILELQPQGPEQESGQIVVNKKEAWKALNLALFFAKDSTFQKMVNGDKEAFRLAFLATETPFFMVETPVAVAGAETDSGSFCGHTMVQHDLAGAPLFLHINSLKHGAAISWTTLKSVAAGKSFTVIPLPSATISGEDVNCIDLAGADVTPSHAPFAAFEEIYAEFQATTDAALTSLSRNAFVASQTATMRRLLTNNQTKFEVTVDPGPKGCNATGPNPNPCYSKAGTSSVCCSTSCSGHYVEDQGYYDPPQLCFAPGGGVDYRQQPSTVNPPDPPASQATLSQPSPCTDAYPNPCFAQNGAYYICCKYAVGECGPPTDHGDPTCKLVNF